MSPPKELTLELVVKVCKIRSETPSPVVHNCPDLKQYVQFLKLIEQAKATGQKQPLTWAIREAVRHNILKDYLERNGGEVLSILMTEYDYATDIAVKQEEAYAIGMERGRLEGLERGAYETKLETARSFIAMGLSLEQVALGTGLPIETVMELAQTK